MCPECSVTYVPERAQTLTSETVCSTNEGTTKTQHRAEIDLAGAEAQPTALGDGDGAIVERVWEAAHSLRTYP